jgi:hypothetical protein
MNFKRIPTSQEKRPEPPCRSSGVPVNAEIGSRWRGDPRILAAGGELHLPGLSSGRRRADAWGMKLFLPFLAVLLCSGCFVIDEIEKGQAIMSAHDGKADAVQESEGSDDAKGPPKTSRERLAEYYAKQRAKAPEPTKNLDPANDVGSCRIGNSVKFMRRSDCRLRGGTFL